MPSFRLRSGMFFKSAAGIGLAALLAACATETASSGGSGSQGVTDKTVKVAGIVTETSAIGYSSAEAELGARARFERANAEGGVHGRTVEFLGAEDDAMTSATGVTAARRLVDKEDVFAVVPVSAPAFGGAEYLDQQKVPWFGWMTNPAWCGLSTAFGFNGCLTPQRGEKIPSWWAAQLGAELGGTDGSVWVQSTDTSSSKIGAEMISRSFEASGFELVGLSSSVPAAAPPQDWLPYVNKVMESDGGGPPDVVVSVMSGTKHNGGFYTALKKAGYKGAITDATSYDPKVMADPQSVAALEGVYAAPQLEPFESDIPEIVQMKADLRKAGGGDLVFSQHMATGYWAADVFLKMLEKTGKDLTRENFLRAADGFSYENPGFGRVAYPQNKTQPTGCGALVRIKGGGFELARHLECFDNVG
ncbi:ABC transporter substrate-binding protein [Actinocorallia populi]|uniref:ABC transporter substrate-binding protein n=1 Tax=Actinocorallia populi TaxID=2079200 RepID=UPI000D0961A9|nr:ABC transporter substrate-binding protein [Actinocorallia populi]